MGLFDLNREKEKDGELVFILNINSSNVCVSIALLLKDLKPKILFSIKEDLNIKEIGNHDQREVLMFKAIKNAFQNINKEGFKHLNFTGLKQKKIKNCICFLSPFWHISKSKKINIELNNKDDEVFSKEDVVSILERESELFEREVSNLPIENNKNFKESEFNIFEKRVMKFYLNGYSVSNPYNKMFHKAKLPIFLSAGRSFLIDNIKKNIYTFFPYIDISFHSSIFSSFVSLRDFFPEKDDFMLVLISAENTEIVIVRDDAIVESISFPIGEGLLIQSLRGANPTLNHEIAESMFRTKENGFLLEETNKNFDKIIKKVKSDWAKTFIESVSSFSEQTFLPRDIFLLSEEHALGSFFSFLIKDHSDIFKVGKNRLNVFSFEENFNLQFVDFGAEAFKDPILALSTFCANRHL